MIHKIKSTEKSKYGINIKEGARSKFIITFKIPLPFIKYLNIYKDWDSHAYKKGWKIFNWQLYLRLRDKKCFPKGFKKLFVLSNGFSWDNLGKQKLLFTREELEDYTLEDKDHILAKIMKQAKDLELRGKLIYG
jgi:hypothetical protein